MRQPRRRSSCSARCVLVVLVGLAQRAASRAPTSIYFLNALISVAIVVAIYVFVGNSGVLSFGQISFVAVGAFASGVHDDPARVEVGRAARPLPDPARPHDRQRALAGARGARSAACSRSCSACR